MMIPNMKDRVPTVSADPCCACISISRFSVSSLLLIITATSGMAADVISIPDDFRDIQTAIEAANEGDIIEVSPGRYLLEQPILIPDKPLTLRSQLGAANTELIQTANTPVILFSGLNPGTISDDITIDGFTLSNGTWGILFQAQCLSEDCQRAVIVNNMISANTLGGIYFSAQSVQIAKNIISKNAGPGVKGSFLNIPIIIDSNTIQENEKSGIELGLSELLNTPALHQITHNTITRNNGYGVYCNRVAMNVERNRISENGESGISSLWPVDGWIAPHARVRIQYNIITANAKLEEQTQGSFGAGIFMYSCNSTIIGNLVADHVGRYAPIQSSGTGSIISGNVVINNTANHVTSRASGLYQRGLGGIISHNVFAYNNSTKFGAVRITAMGTETVPVHLEFNTIAFNHTSGSCSALLLEPGTEGSRISNSIIWGNYQNEIIPDMESSSICIADHSIESTFYYCCISTESLLGKAISLRNGSFSLFPQFVDSSSRDFRLLPGSPCIDTGDPSGDPDPDGTRPDIGAIPFDHWNPLFLRGDVSGDGYIELSDPIGTLLHLFADYTVNCPKAGDMDDDGILNLGDAITLLSYMFSRGPAPRPPFPTPDLDPTPDLLPCGRRR